MKKTRMLLPILNTLAAIFIGGCLQFCIAKGNPIFIGVIALLCIGIIIAAIGSHQLWYHYGQGDAYFGEDDAVQ
ncbi:hypothetical protein ES708_12095 [subsurface metagenome]